MAGRLQSVDPRDALLRGRASPTSPGPGLADTREVSVGSRAQPHLPAHRDQRSVRSIGPRRGDAGCDYSVMCQDVYSSGTAPISGIPGTVVAFRGAETCSVEGSGMPATIRTFQEADVNCY